MQRVASLGWLTVSLGTVSKESTDNDVGLEADSTPGVSSHGHCDAAASCYGSRFKYFTRCCGSPDRCVQKDADAQRPLARMGAWSHIVVKLWVARVEFVRPVSARRQPGDQD